MENLQHLTKTQIPIKLNDCKIVNSYINMVLGTNYNINYVMHSLIEKLNLKYSEEKFLQVPLDAIRITSPDERYMYINKYFKIKFDDNVLSVNCNQKYPGWPQIYELLGNITEELFGIDNNIRFPVLDIQYISAFPDIEIFAKIDGEIKLNCIPTFNNTSFEFSCQIHNAGLSSGFAVAAVKLQNNVPTKNNRLVSLVTIAVRHENKDRDVYPVLQDLNIIHYGEKELFFNLLSDDFIQEQGPEYGNMGQ